MEGGFLAVLRELEHGDTADDLTAKLREMVDAVNKSGGKGKLAMELVFEAAGAGAIEVTPRIKSTLPSKKPERSIFYVTRDGTLSRRDPRQPELPGTTTPGLRAVAGGTE